MQNPNPNIRHILLNNATNNERAAAVTSDGQTPNPNIPDFRNWTVGQIVGYAIVSVLIVVANAAIAAYSDHQEVVKPLAIIAAGLGFIAGVLNAVFGSKTGEVVKKARAGVDAANKEVALKQNVVNKLNEVALALYNRIPAVNQPSVINDARAVANGLQPMQHALHASVQPLVVRGNAAGAQPMRAEDAIQLLTLERINNIN